MNQIWGLRDLAFGWPGRNNLLRGITMDIGAADRILIRGENGSGKSTLLALLMGLLRPANGSVSLWGADPSETSCQAFRKLVFCRQSAAANLFGLVPRHDLEAWRMARPGSFADERVSALGDPLLARLDAPYSTLSGGELRAFTLMWLPLLMDNFWVLDEPLAGLDSTRKAAFTALCDAKRASGSGYIIVSHDPGLPASLFDRVLLLEKGLLGEA